MRSLGAIPLILIVVLVALALDSRRLHALARSTGRPRRQAPDPIPAGANPDKVGLTLRDIQMRINVDWQDGGMGWDGPEILPVDELDDALDEEFEDAAELDEAIGPENVTSQYLPVLWKPFLALPPAGQSDTAESPYVIRNHTLTDSVQKTYG